MSNKQSAILALATAAAALANAATLLAQELGTENTGTTTTPQPEATADAPKRGRGRPAATEAPAPVEQPATPAPEPAKPAGLSYEELRELIRPLVEAGRGEEVKKEIAKYGSSLKEIPADKTGAFKKDIEALLL